MNKNLIFGIAGVLVAVTFSFLLLLRAADAADASPKYANAVVIEARAD